MGSLKKWFMDACTGAWKYTASKVLTGSNMDDAMWATATDGLNKLAGVMAFVTVAAGAYGILRAAATQDIGGVLSAGARTALAWPLTVLCITLAVKGTSLASTMTKSILNTGSLGGSIPGIDKNSLDVFDSGLMTITLCVCVVLGSFVLLLMMAARNFLLIFAIVIAAIPLMLQGWSTMRPLVSKWAGWIVGIILMQPVMALCIWVTCKLMVMSSSTTTTLIAVVGMILSSIFPFTLIKQIADFIPGSVGLMRAGAAGAATVGTAASLAGAAAGLGIQGAAGLSGLASKAGEHGGKSGASGKDKSALSGANPMSSQGSPSEDLHDAKVTGGTGGSQSKTSSEKQAETASSEGGSGSQTESSEGTTSDGVLGVAGAALAGSGFPRAGATVSALGRLYKNSQSNGNSGSSGQEGGSANAADATPPANPSDGLGGVSSGTSASMQGQSIPSEAVDSKRGGRFHRAGDEGKRSERKDRRCYRIRGFDRNFRNLSVKSPVRHVRLRVFHDGRGRILGFHHGHVLRSGWCGWRVGRPIVRWRDSVDFHSVGCLVRWGVRCSGWCGWRVGCPAGFRSGSIGSCRFGCSVRWLVCRSCRCSGSVRGSRWFGFAVVCRSGPAVRWRFRGSCWRSGSVGFGRSVRRCRASVRSDAGYAAVVSHPGAACCGRSFPCLRSAASAWWVWNDTGFGFAVVRLSGPIGCQPVRFRPSPPGRHAGERSGPTICVFSNGPADECLAGRAAGVRNRAGWQTDCRCEELGRHASDRQAGRH